MSDGAIATDKAKVLAKSANKYERDRRINDRVQAL